MSKRALQRAVAIVGSQSALAAAIGKKQGNVWHWLHRANRVPAEYVIPISDATNGIISPHDLRPDLYPRTPAGAAK